MKQITTLVIALASGVMPLFADHHELPKPDKDGWITLFNGKDLAGWDGNPDIWRIKDGYTCRLPGGCLLGLVIGPLGTTCSLLGCARVAWQWLRSKGPL